MFLSIYLSKKNAEVIKFLGIFKKYVSDNKIFLFKKKKTMFRLIKKLLSFTQFSNLFYNADHFLYYLQMSLFSFHTSWFSGL